MSTPRTWYLLTALALILAAIEPSSAGSRGKSYDATPSPGSAADYWIASKASLQQASKHRRLNETKAACEALAKSLDYYRIALDREVPDNVARPVRSDKGDAMQEIRSSFGCPNAQIG